MMNRALSRVAALAAVVVLGACGNNQGTTCRAVPTVIFIPTAPTLVAPANGATGIPPLAVTVQIQSTNPGGQLRLSDAAGNVVFGTAFSPQTPPSNMQSATAPAPGSAGALAAHTTYTVEVLYSVAESNGCVAPGAGSLPMKLYTFPIGSFTTQ
jgi:hypothetical protein